MRTAVSLFVLGIIASSLAYFGSVSTHYQLAAVGDPPVGNVTGWAWGADTVGSSNTRGGVGWISFSSTNHFSSTSYGVNLDQGSGRLSGQAWSDNLGWLSFDCSPGGGCFGAGESSFPDGKMDSYAKVQLTQGNELARPVTGWARFCSVFEKGCSGNFAGNASTLAASTKLGGWDGWVSLSGMTSGADPRPYGVTVHQNDGTDASGLPQDTFHDFAWGGGDVVGWISFAGNGYGVIRGNQALGGSCAPSTNTAIVGVTPVTWTARGYGGSPPYLYNWSENGPSGIASAGTGPTSPNPPSSYASKGTYSRKVTVTDKAGAGRSETKDCSGSVIVKDNQPYFLLRSVDPADHSKTKSSVKLGSGALGTSDQVTIIVEPVKVGNVDFTDEVTLTGTLKNGAQTFSAVFTPDSKVKSTEYGTGRSMTVTVPSPGLTPGMPYSIRVDGVGGGVSASVNIGVNVEGTGAGFEEI